MASQFLEKGAAGFNAKTAMKSANASPASPVDTRTAERAFARSSIKPPSAKNLFFAEYERGILGSANHSAVLYPA